ncbi:MAG: hypothetical protein M1825_001439 [Sarcosagium campestre]|nr:MAG: hypothetical protein M1825_001439 [Sarcosagium campestre]
MAAATIHKIASTGRNILSTDERRPDRIGDGKIVSKSGSSSSTQEPQIHGAGASETSRSPQESDFELLRTLGTGTFARVWLVRPNQHHEGEQGKVYALKVLRKADIIRLKQVEHVQNERSVLADVAGHPFIITMISSFANRDSLYMLLDYCPGGEVFSYLRRAKRFDMETAQFYAAEILLIIEFLHGKAIAYRDLKPENLLIDAEGHIKLVDFGFAKKLPDSAATYTLCGTPEYLAPESSQNLTGAVIKPGHGTSVDWWAFGVLLFEFLVGQPPFWDENPMRIYEKYRIESYGPSGKFYMLMPVHRIVNDPVYFPRGMDPAAQDLISGLCTVDLSQRLGNISGGASRVKAHAFFHGIEWDALYHRTTHGPIVPHIRHAADSSNFDDYPDESESQDAYTDEMYQHYEEAFKDF